MESTAEVMYEEERVGDQRLDFVVGNRLAIELKTLARTSHTARNWKAGEAGEGGAPG